MRARINFVSQNGSKISYDYQYALASALYYKLSTADQQLANALHACRGFRHFCFSGILLNEGIARDGYIFVKSGSLILSSPSSEFLLPFLESFMIDPLFRVNSATFSVVSVDILPEPRFETGTIKFRTLSPIFVKTMKEVNHKVVEWELYPDSVKFYENIRANLIERYKDFFGYYPEDDRFEIKQVHWVKPKRVEIAGTFRRCSLMGFTVDVSRELGKFAYEAGIGEKNAMGFGCLEMIE